MSYEGRRSRDLSNGSARIPRPFGIAVSSERIRIHRAFQTGGRDSKTLRQDRGKRQRAAACVLRKLRRADLRVRSGSAGELFAWNRDLQTARRLHAGQANVAALRPAVVDALASAPATEPATE
jgi:hypothetical protein